MRTIKEDWESYLKLVYPTGLHQESSQFFECRRAFYAGHAGMFKLMNIAADTGTEDEQVQRIEKLHQEIKSFLQDVKDGKK